MPMRSTIDVINDNFMAVPTPQPATGTRGDFSTQPGAWDGYSLSLEPQVQQPLNLWLPLKSRAQFPALQQLLLDKKEAFHQGVLGLRYVHFARFLPTSDYSQLLVITSFDGDIESYLMDFVGVIADLFNAVMQYIAGAPPLPIEEHPDEFKAFIFSHNISAAHEMAAYPQLTTLEVLNLAGMRGNQLRHQPPPPVRLPSPRRPANAGAERGAAS
ncbi:MAG: hypothetical protein QOC57_1134 [Ilumatobacteraceae bacterium]|jgi:hypothetical protein